MQFHKAESSGQITNSGEEQIQVVAVDDFLSNVENPRIDMLKLDVEGAESEVIEGAKKTIGYFNPKLQISVYHKAEDLWSLILQIYELNPYYRFYIGHHKDSIIETVIYAIFD